MRRRSRRPSAGALALLCAGLAAGLGLVPACAEKQKGGAPMQDAQDAVSKELSRCRALLSEKRARVALTEAPPERPAAELGAQGAVGFLARAPDVRVSVYVFPSQRAHQAAAEKLRATVPAEGTKILWASNGRLLFFGHTRVEGPDGVKAKFRLNDLVSAFSGDE